VLRPHVQKKKITKGVRQTKETNLIFFLQVATTLSWSEVYDELEKYRLIGRVLHLLLVDVKSR
jgi:hypothetical protein